MHWLVTLPLDIWFQVPADRPNWNMAYSLTIAGIGFMLTAAGGYFIINFLKRKGIGKHIRIDGPQDHIKTKTGTPTMGANLCPARNRLNWVIFVSHNCNAFFNSPLMISITIKPIAP